jgi:amidase
MAEDLMFQPVTELAASIREGDVSAREAVEASFGAIDRLNGELNAFVTLCEERALAEADAIEQGDSRPLAGVPIAIKDLVQLTEGVRTTMGMNCMEDFVPPIDSALVRRLREAGAIVVGKTNTPELGILPVTEPERFGATRNPWDTSRTPGGSSGGSAAAVAAGMVPVGHANDGGGSIRIPASCCGLVGLKPSRGRVSLAPLTEFVAGIGIDGCVSRTVADTALVLDIISGYEPGDPYWAPPPPAPFGDAVERAPGDLRIAVMTESPTGVPVHEDCATAVREAAALLESLGHSVFEAPTLPAEGYIENFIRVWASGVAISVRGMAMLRGAPLDQDNLEPLTRELVALAEGLSAADYLESVAFLQTMGRMIVSMWSDLDVLITPTLAQPPVKVGSLAPKAGEPAMAMIEKAAEWVPFTPVWNATGQPAISLPLHHSDEGLPIGVQLVGPPAGEEVLLSLSAQLEEARPWAARRPELATA